MVKKGMKAVFVSAEVAPFAKVGGLGDVAGALPKALSKMGVDVTIFMPRYGHVNPEQWGFVREWSPYAIWFDGQEQWLGLWKGHLPGCPEVTVYLVDHEYYFGSRQGVYPWGDYDFEIEGFRFFSEGVLDLCKHLDIRPDILHVHDWHTAPAAVRLSYIRMGDEFYHQTKSVLTIHNLKFQGRQGDLNWLAEGFHHADWLTTVSPNYAREIQTQEGGFGLDGWLRMYSGRTSGIVNGIDTEVFNPASDPNLFERYDAQSVDKGKALCKHDLQKQLGLEVDPKKPLFAMVSRLSDQKGIDILIEALESRLGKNDAQFLVLGSGDGYFQSRLAHLSHQYQNMSAYLGFNAALAQKIYAGADFFLMPSGFEPCGIGQLIAMRYGTLPIVRQTGGLVDTVVDAVSNPKTGTGIWFEHYVGAALDWAIGYAIELYGNKAQMKQLIQNAMGADYSWDKSAQEYLALYQRLVGKKVKA